MGHVNEELDSLSLDEMPVSSSSCSTPPTPRLSNSGASSPKPYSNKAIGMGYGESEELHFFSLRDWITYADLQHWARTLIGTQFFEPYSRGIARIQFNNMNRARNIVNKATRFPTEFYVCLGNKSILDIILNVMLSLDMPASDIDAFKLNYNNRKNAFDSAVKDLNMALCSPNYSTMSVFGIYTRTSFEGRHSLVWNDGNAEAD